MNIYKFSFFGLALGGLLLIGAEARAVTVTYTTVGTFTGGLTANSNVYTDSENPDIVIVFDGALNDFVDAPPASQTSFGEFDTSLIPATVQNFEGVSSGFILDIFQSTPSAGATQFVGSLTGMLRFNNSQAFIQFDQNNLQQQIGLVTYRIASADGGVPGRVFIAPPTTNNGLTTIVGEINVIPEPSAIALATMGAVAPIGLALRRRMTRGQATP